MKTIYKTITKPILVLVCIMTIQSCSDDFLEIVPKGVIIAQTTKDYDLLFNDYSFYDADQIGWQLLALRSPEACGIEPHFSVRYAEANRMRRNFTWEPDAFEPDQDLSWLNTLLKRTYTLNKIIGEVQSSSGGTQEDRDRIYSEALAARAATYFIFINLYGLPYNETTATNDLGFPIITKSDVTQTEFTRASVQEVYDFIITDLTNAIPNLPDSVTDRIRMSKGAAHALLAKINVYMGNFQEAIPQFDAAFNHFQNGLELGLHDYNSTTLPGGIQEPGPFGPTNVLQGNNIEFAYTIQYANPIKGLWSQLLLSPEASALYGPTDFRLNYFCTRFPFRSSTPFPVTGVFRAQGKQQESSLGVRISDMYLLRAECKARTGDLAGAITDLEFLRKHRMPEVEASVPVGLSQDDLTKFVIDERTREFALDGTLWFDMRRLWNDPLFSDKVYTHTLYNDDGTVKETYTLTDEKRLVLRFTDKIISQNPGMENNP